MSLQIHIEDNAKAVLAQVQGFPGKMAAAIAKAMDYQNELTVGAIQRDKLSLRGPDTLGVRTNRLRKSVNRTKAVVAGNTVVSAIGSNVVYAAAHEYGFNGTVQVKEHKRRIIAYDRYEKVGGRFRQTQSGIRGTVRAHSMKMNIKARAPFHKTIDEREQDYSRSISAGILAAWEGLK